MRRERRIPRRLVEVLAPGVEARPVAPGRLHHRSEPAVSAAQRPLENRFARIVPSEIEPRAAAAAPQQLVLGRKLGGRLLTRPLERRVRLRHVIGGRDPHPRALAHDLAADRFHLRGPVHDPLHIGHRLRRQPHHEVQLDAAPAVLKRIARGLQQVLVGHHLAHRVAQPLAAGLRRERHARLLARRAEQRRIHAERIHPCARQRDADPIPELRPQRPYDLVDLAVIGAAQGDQRQLVEACIREQLARPRHHLLRRPLAQRAVDHSRLAETAALRAAALNLDPRPVMHRLQIRHDRLGQNRRQPLHEALHDRDRRRLVGRRDLRRCPVCRVAPPVEARHVHALDPRQTLQSFEAARAAGLGRPQQLVDLQHHILGLAEHERVDERSQRLRNQRPRTARKDDRIALSAHLRANRNPRQVQHLEHVRVGQLVRQREAQRVKLAQRTPILQAEQRRAAPPQRVRHVRPRRVAALRQRPRRVIEQVVENRQPAVGLPDVVEVRINQRPAGLRVVPVPLNHVPLAAHVAGRLGDALQQRVDFEPRHRSHAPLVPARS